MAKTYLQLSNAVLRMIPQTILTDVTAVTGTTAIVTDNINQAQLHLNNIDQWYSLLTSRTFATVASTATVAVAADHSRTLDMFDTTNSIFLYEEFSRTFDMADPDQSATGVSTSFTLEGSNYRFYPIPAGVNSITERYWKIPTTLAANGDTSDLPFEVENCIIYFAHYLTLNALGKIEQGILAKQQYNELLKYAKEANRKKIDRIKVISNGNIPQRTIGPQFPSTFGRRYRFR